MTEIDLMRYYGVFSVIGFMGLVLLNIASSDANSEVLNNFVFFIVMINFWVIFYFELASLIINRAKYPDWGYLVFYLLIFNMLFLIYWYTRGYQYRQKGIASAEG